MTLKLTVFSREMYSWGWGVALNWGKKKRLSNDIPCPRIQVEMDPEAPLTGLLCQTAQCKHSHKANHATGCRSMPTVALRNGSRSLATELWHHLNSWALCYRLDDPLSPSLSASWWYELRQGQGEEPPWPGLHVGCFGTSSLGSFFSEEGMKQANSSFLSQHSLSRKAWLSVSLGPYTGEPSSLSLSCISSAFVHSWYLLFCSVCHSFLLSSFPPSLVCSFPLLGSPLSFPRGLRTARTWLTVPPLRVWTWESWLPGWWEIWITRCSETQTWTPGAQMTDRQGCVHLQPSRLTYTSHPDVNSPEQSVPREQTPSPLCALPGAHRAPALQGLHPPTWKAHMLQKDWAL